MPLFPFRKFSPSGNSTLFLLGKIGPGSGEACRQALLPEGVCAEQCGMADLESSRLQMGAGEFCANACRAFGALLAMRDAGSAKISGREFQMTASGASAPVRLRVSGQLPLWHVEASFILAGVKLERVEYGATLARLPGICHLLLEEPWPAPAELESAARQLRAQWGLEKLAASGIVWWRREGAALRLLPHVAVPASGTAMLESACGSASLALALALQASTGQSDFSILQPSGGALSISLGACGEASLGGAVRLCASGELWLPEGSAAKDPQEPRQALF